MNTLHFHEFNLFFLPQDHCLMKFILSYITFLEDSWYRAIGLMSKVFVIGLGDRGSIPGRVILKTQKLVLDVALLNTQHYKVRIKSKMEQFREWSNTLPYTSV